MKLNKIILLIAVISMFTACQEEYEPEMIAGHEVAGEWFAQTYYGGSPVIGHEHILTYNTAAADGKQMWFDDLGHIWPVKAKIDISGSTFAGTGDNMEVPIYSYDTLDIERDPTVDPIDSVDQNFEGYETITIMEGKIIEDAGKSKTGVTVDSIYVRCSFSDDPGEEYEIKGHRRTGFVEDDY